MMPLINCFDGSVLNVGALQATECDEDHCAVFPKMCEWPALPEMDGGWCRIQHLLRQRKSFLYIFTVQWSLLASALAFLLKVMI